MSSSRIVYSAAQPLASVSTNERQLVASASSKGRSSNRRLGAGSGRKPAGVCTAGESRHKSRHSRRPRGSSPRGTTTKRRTHGRRQQLCSGDAVPHPNAPTVEQLSMLLAASQLGNTAQAVPTALSPRFTLRALTAEEEDSDDECCGEMDPYTAAARGTVPATTTQEGEDAEEMMLAAALAQSYQATDTLLDEHAAQHQTMIVERWRAQQQLTQQQKQKEQQQQLSLQHTARNTTAAPIKLVLMDGAEEVAVEVAHRDSLSPVSVAPDSPGESQPKPSRAELPPSHREVIPEERKVQAAELKEQGQALMAAGDYMNAGGTFGIAKGLDPTDEELPALEASADAQAASAATPSTCASEYALMYQAWLSSGTAENLETAQMAVC